MLLPNQSRIVDQAKFTKSRNGKAFEKQLKVIEKK